MQTSFLTTRFFRSFLVSLTNPSVAFAFLCVKMKKLLIALVAALLVSLVSAGQDDIYKEEPL
jgi:subtilase family serine protease